MDNDLCVCHPQAQANSTNYDEDAFFHTHEISDRSGTFKKTLYDSVALKISVSSIPLLSLVKDSAIDIRPEFFGAEGSPVEQDVG
jgi:hypothetical protein